ncbi:ATP dependent DNA ligase (fragment) [Mesorhizobium prunaredense]|uniref:ATP dependent DNA ligase n=1 Tax=Mesorhizobium prunaredense TaxID=1631249 RepID=A0A1R3VE29_9HYPH
MCRKLRLSFSGFGRDAAAPFNLLGVKREHGRAAFAYLADPRTGKYRGSAFITVGHDIKDRQWKRVRENAGPPPKELKKKTATQWVKPGVVTLRVEHLRGEHGHRA